MNVNIKGLISAVFIAALALSPQLASANTGAGATILNVVTVNYKDASGTTALKGSAFATVTVQLVAAPVTLSAPADAAVASGTVKAYTYTVTSQANGTDTYPLGSTVNASTNIGAPTIAFKQAGGTITSLTLGASVISQVTATTIDIPAGSAANLAVGDVVVIGGVAYKISVVAGANTAASHNTTTHATTAEVPVTLTLTTLAAAAVNPTAAGIVVGALMAEQQTFTAEITATTSAVGDGTATVTINVGGGTGKPAATGDQTITTFQGANLTIVKEVSTDGGLTFAATGSAAPAAVLTYRITITNNGGGNATSVVISDPMPAYTAYNAGTAKLDITAAAVTYAAAATVLTDANDAPATDTFDYNVSAAGTATYSAGTVAAAARVVLFYQVTVQ